MISLALSSRCRRTFHLQARIYTSFGGCKTLKSLCYLHHRSRSESSAGHSQTRIYQTSLGGRETVRHRSRIVSSSYTSQMTWLHKGLPGLCKNSLSNVFLKNLAHTPIIHPHRLLTFKALCISKGLACSAGVRDNEERKGARSAKSSSRVFSLRPPLSRTPRTGYKGLKHEVTFTRRTFWTRMFWVDGLSTRQVR